MLGITAAPDHHALTVSKREEELACAHLKGASILVVEDYALNREIMEEILRAAGFMCTLPATAKKPCKRSRIQHFDGIIMDCQMPIMDG